MSGGRSYSSRSRRNLRGCEPVIGEFARRLLIVSPTDLSILSSTLRSVEQQREFVRKGVSRTMKSKHLPNERGLSEAVDIGIYIPGVNVWKIQGVYDMYEDLHEAAQSVARDMDLDIRSGICWQNLNTDKSFDDLLWEYRSGKRRQSKRPFFDGPHFEIIGKNYAKSV